MTIVTPKPRGRPKGSRNKATLTLKQRFQKHERFLVAKILQLCRSSDANVRLRAVSLALERGWGKAPQPLTGEGGEGPVIKRIERVIVSEDKAVTHTQEEPKPVVH